MPSVLDALFLFLALASARADGQPPGPPDPGTAPAAIVGDQAITIADIDREWRRTDPTQYGELSQQLYEARRRAAESLVAERLLAIEAASRGRSVDDLLAEELPRHTRGVTDYAIASLYQSLGEKTKGATLDQMRPSLRAWLERRAIEDARSNYVEELRKTSTRTRILLEPPRFAVERSSLDPALGPVSAPVEIVLFATLTGTSYPPADATLTRVRDTFRDRVRLVFKNLREERVAAEAARLGARSDPTFFVNGRMVAYLPPFEFFKQIIDEELLRQAKPASPDRR